MAHESKAMTSYTMWNTNRLITPSIQVQARTQQLGPTTNTNVRCAVRVVQANTIAIPYIQQTMQRTSTQSESSLPLIIVVGQQNDAWR